MAAMKEWLLDRQLEGDDGTGHCDYSPVLCNECAEQHSEENKQMSIALCGDCLIPVGDCACPA